jgi:hypothetical protein
MVKKVSNEFVDTLVKGGWKLVDAEAKIDQITKAINSKFPKATPEFVQSTLKASVNKLLRSHIEQMEGVCVGYDVKQDSNSFAKRKAYEVYEQDPVRAAQDKFVVTDVDGKVVFEKDEKGNLKRDNKGNTVPLAADNREFIDPDTKKMKNAKWGKALGEVIQRTAWFIMDVNEKRKFVRAFGNFDVKLGYQYTLYGSMSKTGNITIPVTGPGVKAGKLLDDVDYWKVFNDTAQNDDLAVPLGESVDILKNKPIVTKGFVTTVRQAGTRMMIVINDDSMPEGMVCFVADEGLNEEAEALSAGNEIVLIGRIGESVDKTDGKIRRNITTFGFASNPESDKIASAVRELDSELYS